MTRKRFSPKRFTWRRYLPEWAGPGLLLLMLLASVAAAWFMRDTMQDVVNSSAYTLWTLGLRLRGLPQDEIWGILVFMALLHLFLTLSRKFSPPSFEPHPYKQVGPVRSWIELLQLNPQPNQLGRVPLSRLQQVTLSALAQPGGHSESSMRARLRTGNLDIDPALQTYLQTGRSQTPHLPATQAPEMDALLDLLEKEIGG